jgi:hypothetical protein
LQLAKVTVFCLSRIVPRMVRPPLRSLLLGRLVTLIGDKPAGHDVYFSSILFSMSGAVEVYVSRQPFFFGCPDFPKFQTSVDYGAHRLSRERLRSRGSHGKLKGN